MSFLLDSNVCIALLNTQDGPVRSRFNEFLLDGESMFISSIVIFELTYGVEKSLRSFANNARLADLVQQQSAILAFDDKDARSAASIRAKLESRKQPIGPMDTLIAGQALARNLILVTANSREFARVEGLNWQDWSQA